MGGRVLCVCVNLTNTIFSWHIVVFKQGEKKGSVEDDAE